MGHLCDLICAGRFDGRCVSDVRSVSYNRIVANATREVWPTNMQYGILCFFVRGAVMSVLLAVNSCKANLSRRQVKADGLDRSSCFFIKYSSSVFGSMIEALWCLSARLRGLGLVASHCGLAAGG